MVDGDAGRDLTGSTIVITGASAGIGAAAARRLSGLGANVIAIGRCRERTLAVAAEFGATPVVADFAHLDQVRADSQQILARCPSIDVLVNNAGGIVPRRTITEDGYEATFQINHLAGFLLTHLLLNRLQETARTRDVRVIATSSFANRFARIRVDDLQPARHRYGNGWTTYCATKLMNIMFTTELARRTAGTGLRAVCFHPDPGPDAEPSAANSPDAVPTNFARETVAMRAFHRIPRLRDTQLTGARGSQPLIRLIRAPDVVNGAYYNGPRLSTAVNRQAKKPALAAELWEQSVQLLAPWL